MHQACDVNVLEVYSLVVPRVIIFTMNSSMWRNICVTFLLYLCGNSFVSCMFVILCAVLQNTVITNAFYNTLLCF